MGAENFVFLSGPKPNIKNKARNEMQRIILSINELCDYNEEKAKQLSVQPLDMVLEPFDDKPFAKNRLIGPTDVAVELAKEIRKRNKNFGLLLDLSHLAILDEDYRECLKKAAKFIKHIHIGNCVLRNRKHEAYGDEHPRFCIEEGEICAKELAEFIEALSEIDYLDNVSNAISFEVKPLLNEYPDLTIVSSKRTLMSAPRLANLG